MTKATYERDKQLRIRKEPSTEAEIVGYIKSGKTVDVIEVADGWCEIEGGFIMESLVTLTDDEAAELPAEKVDEKTDEATEDNATEDETGDSGEAENTEQADATDGEAAELRKMTNPQLYDLCIKSGVKVKKNASKDAMIAALTSPDA